MSRAADSAGIPFDGREFRPHPFAGDDGDTPFALRPALDRWAQATTTDAYLDLVAALPGVRILIPLIAEAGEWGETAEGLRVDKTQELSIPTVRGPDHQPVGLIFTDVASLCTWRGEARPQPAEIERAAAWSIEEGIGRLVLNPGSPSECVLRRGVLVSLLRQAPYTPPWVDPEVRAVIEAGLEGTGTLQDIASGWAGSEGSGPDLVVTVALPPGLTDAERASRQQTWAGHWASSSVIAERVDGIRLRVIAGG